MWVHYLHVICTTSFYLLMTMTTCSCTHTAAALAEEAGAVNDLHLSAAQQALSNCRQPPVSIVIQFQSFTTWNPTVSLTHIGILCLRTSMVLKTSVTMDLFPVTVSLTIMIPLQNIVTLATTNGLAQRMILEMIWMTPEMATTMTMTRNSLTPWRT